MSDSSPSPWFIDDEPRNARYYFVPIFNIVEEPLDIDETITERSLVDIQVVAAEEFDDRGHVQNTWNQPEASRFNNRAWKLLSRDTSLREYLEGQTVQEFPRSQRVLSTKSESTASTLSKMREQRHTNQAQEDQTKRRSG